MNKVRLQGKFYFLVLFILLLPSCGQKETPSSIADDAFTEARLELVKNDIEGAGITNEDVIQAMQTVPRHEFVPAE